MDKQVQPIAELNQETVRGLVARLQQLRDACEARGDDDSADMLTNMVRLGVAIGLRFKDAYPVVKASQDLLKVAKPSEPSEQAMVALAIPAEASQKLIASIQGQLASGITPIDNLHITLAYLGRTKDIDADQSEVLDVLKIFAGRHQPIKGKIGGVARFIPGNGKTPLVVLFDSADLPKFRQDLVDDLELGVVPLDSEHGFVPHITLAYLTQDSPKVEIDVEPIEMCIDAISLVWGNMWTKLELTGTQGMPAPTSEWQPHVYLELLDRIGPLKVWRVDGMWIRKHMGKAGEEFTNWSHHYILSDIPENELWIDENAAGDKEYPFFIQACLMHYKLMKAGMSYNKALDISNRKEKGMRAKYESIPIPADNPETDLSLILMQPLGTIVGCDLWLVNEDPIHAGYDQNMVEDGHWLVYDYVPSGQVWIGNSVLPEERDYIKLHLAVEINLMRIGLKYPEAHAKASRAEWEARQHPETLEDAIEAQNELARVPV